MLNKIIFNISLKKIKFNIFLLLAIVDDEYFSELASIATPQFYNIIFMGSWETFYRLYLYRKHIYIN